MPLPGVSGKTEKVMTFKEIYGHEKQIAILKSAMANDRIAHAYLFYGMEGIGKRTTAAVFAGALNCGEANPPCGACPSCRKAAHKTHPNIITIQAEGQFIKIGAVKELQEQMKFRPGEGRRRVFILEEADRMNAAAANALLKTLEEPSAGNILLLTTARPHALPMTILSRCQHLRFAPLPREEVARFLREKKALDAGYGGGTGRLVGRQHRQGAGDEPGEQPHPEERDPGTPRAGRSGRSAQATRLCRPFGRGTGGDPGASPDPANLLPGCPGLPGNRGESNG